MGEPALSGPSFDPDFLKHVSAASGPGLDATDPRLDEIAAAIFRSDYHDAALQAQAIWSSGVVDARLLGYFLLGNFIERGPGGLPKLFQTATEALTTRWEAFVPRDRKGVLAGSNLAWLFEHILKRLEHHQRLQDAQWRAWWSGPDIDVSLMDAEAVAPGLEAAIAAAIPGDRALTRFRRLRRWIAEFATAPQAKPRPAARVAHDEEDSPPDDQEDEMEDDDEDGESPEVEPAGAAPQPPGDLSAESPAMALLLRKLQAFQVLVKRGQFQKAAVVALDLDAVMTSFDPRVYFPRLFAPYFSVLHEHAEELEPCMSDPDSFTARTLAQLYRVDLETFVRGR